MLYQKGEKLKILKETIKDIPKLSGLHKSYFVMSQKEKRKFEAPIRKLFNELNNVLYNALISSESIEEKTDKVYKVVGRIILYLDDNFKEDIIDNFYEEKLSYYENMFVILVRDELCTRYKEYKNILMIIPNGYKKTYEEYKHAIPSFTTINDFISDFKEINEDLQDTPLYDCTKTYLIHCLELILEKISELVKDECRQCTEDISYSGYWANRLRYLIYLLKKEFPLDAASDEQ